MEARRASPEELARVAEEAVARVLGRYLAGRASNYLLTVKVEADGEGGSRVVVDLEVLSGPPGLDLEAVVEEAVKAARREVDRYVRSLRRRRADVEGQEVRGGHAQER